MNQNPLEFARQFEKFRNRFRRLPATDARLLLAVQFWPDLKEKRDLRGYLGYFEEFASLIRDTVSPAAVQDLLPKELESTLDMIQDLRRFAGRVGVTEGIDDAVRRVGREAASKFFYAGEIQLGLRCLARAYGSVVPSIKLRSDNITVSEFETLREVHRGLASTSDPLADLIRQMLELWSHCLNDDSFDSANCLFVEKNADGQDMRGRLRDLRGEVSLRRTRTNHHDLTLDSRPKTPDDPFVGSLHNALNAVSRVAVGGASDRRKANRVRARYWVADSDHTFTGDSIGLAAGLIAYAQLLRPEVHRNERFIAASAAFTGGLDDTGHITPVEGSSLSHKVDRAFFSPLKYLVLPRENLEAATARLDELKSEYPRRRLHLVAVSSLGEVLEDLRVVRSQKICPGEYLTRKALKYSRATKIQVPLLSILILLFGFILADHFLPECTKPWGDCNPEYVRVTTHGFEALNQDSIPLWEAEFECDQIGFRSVWDIGDLDRDGLNEIVFAPCGEDSYPCDTSAVFYAYDGDGTLLFCRSAIILGEYPGDSTYLQSYNIGSLRVLEDSSEPKIVSTISESFPARTHLVLWGRDGSKLGWYVNPGACFAIDRFISTSWPGCIMFVGINNFMSSVCLLVLPEKGWYGAAPPYSDSILPGLSEVCRGNQMHYIVFPRSDVTIRMGRSYNVVSTLAVESGEVITVRTFEGGIGDEIELWYELDTTFRVRSVKPSDDFIEMRDSLVRANALDSIATSDLLNLLRNNVEYWSDSGWQTHGESRQAFDQ